MSIQCKVTVIADSISAITNKRMTTIVAEYPRIVLSELNTHRMLGKNSSSSRAIPVEKVLDQIMTNPAMPVRFGAKNKGMQDAGEFDGLVESPFEDEFLTPEQAWRKAMNDAALWANAFDEAGYAKQICNRLVEAGQMMKTVISGTDWNNLLWLRDHEAADPTIAQLAVMIREALENSTPVVLQPGEWHVPYFNDGVWKPVDGYKKTEAGLIKVDRFGHSLEHALTISASCCAQVSFRTLNDTIEKARSVVKQLNLHGEQPDQPVHASPLEHQATPVNASEVGGLGKGGVNCMSPTTWQEGITHMTRDSEFCSGNLNGWIQHRQLVPNHVKRG